jgi:enamine deaminase RidA (YjgF/YER057c/UK114 family)
MERHVVDPWTWQHEYAFVQTNEVTGAERVLYCAGQTSVDADGENVHEGDMEAQIAQALDNIEAVLRAAGFTLADVVRLNYYTTDVDAFLEAGAASVARLEAAGCQPTSTLLRVARLAFPSLLVEIEATAVR